MERQMIDIHCHLVPGVDDGATNIEMAMGMLCLSSSRELRVFLPHPTAAPLTCGTMRQGNGSSG